MDERPVAVTEPAPAKLNLFLRVLRRRPDGFHDIETVVAPITLADGVQVRRARGLSLAVTGERADEVPGDEGNLALAAARRLREACETAEGADIALVKRIPVASGLGGGSADAAATLRALNDLWGCGLEVPALLEVASRVGSDVPALVHGGVVVASGRGDIVRPIEAARTWWVVLVPEPGVGAGEAYGWWDEDGPDEPPDPDAVLRALLAGDVEALAPALWNGLEGPVTRRRPDVAEARGALLRAGALGALMSGSGPAVAGLARDGRHAEELAATIGGTAVSTMAGHPGGHNDPSGVV